MKLEAKLGELIEWDYISKIKNQEPFEVELDIIIISPTNKKYKIPAFWREDSCWSVRFIARESGEYFIVTNCMQDSSLNDIKSILIVNSGKEPFIKLKVSKDRKYLIKNQEPFFWLSDTWWMALSSRLSFNEFKYMAHYRKKQGFNIIQLVAGLMPDMDSFDKRGANEAGFAWEEDYKQINPKYFDKADQRVLHLYNLGFSICILGSWGYYLKFLGQAKMKQFWRYIIARWGALDTIWCIAGETTMPFYLSRNRSQDSTLLKSGWSDIAKYIKSIEPFGNLITTHPIESSINELNNSSILDINLLQASHNNYSSIIKAIKLLKDCQILNMPTIMNEINYEGILRDNLASTIRLSFWSSILNGSVGFGYGANGVWQINQIDKPFGVSPSGATWGNMPWSEAIKQKGAQDISRAKIFLEQFKWWELEAKSKDILPKPNPIYNISMAGIKKELRLIYIYEQIPPWHSIKYIIKSLETNSLYKAHFWNPSFEQTVHINPIQSNQNGEINLPIPPSLDEWVLVLEFKEKIKVNNKFNFKKIFKKVFLLNKN